MAQVPLAIGDVPDYFPLNLTPTLTACFYGPLISIFLFGIFCDQVYQYWQRYKSTGNRLDHVLVAICVAFSVWITVCQITFADRPFIRHYGEPAVVSRFINSPYVWSLGGNAVIQLVAQIFFANRAWLLYERNKLMGAVLAILILAAFGAGVGVAVQHTIDLGRGASFQEIVKSIRVVSNTKNITASVMDLGVTVAISYRLVHVQRGVFKSTDSVINKLLALSLSTAALTSLTAVALAICVLIGGQASFAATPLAMLLPRVYANSMLWTLNSREGLSEQATSQRGVTDINAKRYNQPVSSQYNQYTTPQGINIQLETVTRVEQNDEKAVEAGYGASRARNAELESL